MKIIVTYLLCIFIFFNPLSAQEVVLETSRLPIFIINTFGEEIPNEPKINAHLGIIANENGNLNNIQNPYNEYDGNIGIEIRGNSSVELDKVSYQLETRLPSGENNNVSLLEMPKENDWILHGPYLDKSLLRNVLMYELAREMGYYASRTEFCELIINGEYQGIYILMEKIKNDKNRIDVTKFEADNQQASEGGFILKIDSWWTEDRGWKSPAYKVNDQDRITRYQYVYPKYNTITDAQKLYIENHITDFENAFYESEDDDIQAAYSPYIDLVSFVDYFILTEFSKNPDGYRLSTFLYKDADSVDGRLKMGPVWDYNFAFGNYWDYQNVAEDWEYDNHWWDITSRIPFWWEKFMEDEQFKSVLVKRWKYWQQQPLNCDFITQRIDDWVAQLGEAQSRNFARWKTLGENVEIDWNAGPTYEDEITYLKEWTCARIEWMNEALKINIDPLEAYEFSIFPNPTKEGFTIRLNANAASTTQLQIVDLLGRLHFEKEISIEEGEQVIPVDTKALSNGTYIVHLFNDEFSKAEIIYID